MKKTLIIMLITVMSTVAIPFDVSVGSTVPITIEDKLYDVTLISYDEVSETGLLKIDYYYWEEIVGSDTTIVSAGDTINTFIKAIVDEFNTDGEMSATAIAAVGKNQYLDVYPERTRELNFTLLGDVQHHCNDEIVIKGITTATNMTEYIFNETDTLISSKGDTMRVGENTYINGGSFFDGTKLYAQLLVLPIPNIFPIEAGSHADINFNNSQWITVYLKEIDTTIVPPVYLFSWSIGMGPDYATGKIGDTVITPVGEANFIVDERSIEAIADDSSLAKNPNVYSWWTRGQTKKISGVYVALHGAERVGDSISFWVGHDDKNYMFTAAVGKNEVYSRSDLEFTIKPIDAYRTGEYKLLTAEVIENSTIISPPSKALIDGYISLKNETLYFEHIGHYNIEVFNMLGQQVFQKKVSGDQSIEVLTNVSSGKYILTVTEPKSNETLFRQKITVR